MVSVFFVRLRGCSWGVTRGTRIRYTVELVRRYTVPEAARWLARNPFLVRRWLREGRLRGEKFGRDWTVTQWQLERFKGHEPERRERRSSE